MLQWQLLMNKTKSSEQATEILKRLDAVYPYLAMQSVHGHDPYHMLVAIILSQRSKDSSTIPTASRLFALAPTPTAMLTLSTATIESIIRPVGFFRTKAAAIKEVSHILVEKYGGQVPQDSAQLLALPRVGRKTAHILLTMFFSTPRIAVDTHVHRICNRLGILDTKNVKETEEALTRLVPPSLHSIVNRVFVAHGQSCCTPKAPRCGRCPIREYCKRRGVDKARA